MTTTSRSEPVRLLCLALVAAIGLAAPACKRRSVDPSTSPPALSVPTPPRERVADLSVRNPGATWRALRAMSGELAILPESYAVTVTTMLGLPPAAATLIDETGPVLGVLLDNEVESSAVLGLHVRSSEELVAALTRGSDAKFSVVATGPVRELVARPGANVENVHFGVDADYLLVARRSSDLALGGRYVAEGLAARPISPAPILLTVPHSALAGTFARRVRERWATASAELSDAAAAEQQRHGRAADFGDPRAVIDVVGQRVSSLTDVISQAQSVEVRIEPLLSGLLVRADLVADARGPTRDWLASLPAGSVDPMLALPGDAAAALWVKRLPARDFEDVESAMDRILGGRVAPSELAKVHDALSHLARGLGDSVAMGFVRGSVALRASVADPTELDAGIEGMLGVVTARGFAELVQQMLGRPSVAVTKKRIAGVSTPVTDARVSFARRGSAPASARIAWTIDGSTLFLAAGTDVEPALVALTTSSRAARTDLGGRAELQGFSRSLGNSAATALVVDLARLGFEADSKDKGLVLAALGHGSDRAWLRVELPAAPMAMLARRLLVR